MFTNLYVANKKTPINPEQELIQNKINTYTLKKHLNSLDNLELAYKQSPPISIEFISPNIKLPSHFVIDIDYRD